MTDRERLIELLIKAKVTWNVCGIADYLLANGVIVPVRCKDCEYLSKNKFYCDFYKIAIIDNGFCYKAKLKECEGK